MDLGIQLAALIICACAVSSEDIPDLEDSIPRFEQICDLFAKDSYFRPNHLVEGKRWRIYYTWNIEMRDRCVDMTFEWATVAATQRLWSDMHEYLETEPPWEAALLLMTMGSRDHQMMLFPDQGPAGRMLGVPNVRRDAMPNCPYLAFALKVVEPGYLGIMNCKQRYAFALAPLAEAAARLMFQSPLGRSHLTRPKPVQQTYEEDDIDDDEMELERQAKRSNHLWQPQSSTMKPKTYAHPVPVDFINIGKEGIMDPRVGQKQPLDSLALDLRYPNSPEEEVTMLQKADPRNVIRISKGKKYQVPQIDLSEYPTGKFNPYYNEQQREPAKTELVNVKMPMPFDFEMLQAMNVALPNIYKDNLAKTEALFKSKPQDVPEDQKENIEAPLSDPIPIAFKADDFFPLDSFDLKTGASGDVDKWTTCDEFAKNARFHPREVAGVVWVPFFVWSPNNFPSAIDFKFTYPTVKLVQEYRTIYGPYLNESIDWNQPMLLLKSWMEMLLVAGDRKGLFYAIPKASTDQIRNATGLPQFVTLRMKMIDPLPYLALMVCDEHFAMILAVSGEEPAFEDMAAEADKLGFRGIGMPVVKDEEATIAKTPDETLNRMLEATAYRRHKSPFFSDDPYFT
ncbi:hypothetical protein MSG28_005822 [Choristoneura fumiferana]|uniref:Uncharacterized protein n=1 Tax=Choristoneura fumiferana TaxID=7141 RepID=A0ACC0L0G3_CHOFU|nr:hypothetical protein MSG28_005822 [Choristoneura fumiferana]